MRKVLAAAAMAWFLPVGAWAETTAIVIGVDNYPFTTSLNGAVNDAKDIDNALKKAGISNITTFYDAEARKDAIRASWERAVANSVAGDTIIFTYAGHGAQMPELVEGSEPDGKDEFLVLPGFNVERLQETFSESIIDNELNSWFMEADAKGIQVLFILDSCHSGGMSRAVSGKTRLAPAVTAKIDNPSQESVAGAGISDDSFKRVTVLAASLESQPTPEVIIDGVPRGALSWSFARSLEGKADRNHDGVLTRVELEDYVFSTIKSQAEALQVPNFVPGVARSEKEVVVRLAGASTETTPVPVEEEGWKPQIALAVEGSGFRPERVVDGGAAPYRWDAASGTFFTPNGDVAGEKIGEDRLQQVVDKFILLEFLKAMAAQNPGTVTLTPAKDIYAAGDRMKFDAPRSSYKNLLVFNLANTGEAQLLDAQSGGEDTKPFSLPDLEVVKPFGADHLIVLATNEPIDALSALLNKPNVSASDLLKALPERFDGKDVQISIQPLYSREKL
ncbi:hypothetical protein DEM27_14670 [Metarhizobium album]|uniref:Peptidase C14 caspase domain-containing protein n=1 Tax=Metarhizobium album TaxID=2182425 RepID=A0A2U2DPU7_9HYPH|nr:caspase family protein [Rhizobium album]OJT95420.1 MAG: hypothetical protein BGN83_20825 [Rhizobium sp. 63-7]PWE55311.1 hypothetical protein DEM27_14670 [Rhizobium album]